MKHRRSLRRSRTGELPWEPVTGRWYVYLHDEMIGYVEPDRDFPDFSGCRVYRVTSGSDWEKYLGVSHKVDEGMTRLKDLAEGNRSWTLGASCGALPPPQSPLTRAW